MTTVTRLVGGVSPADAGDPRTFPQIWNATADLIEANEAGLDFKAPLLLVENVQTGNYTLALSDVAKVVAMNNTTAATVTVPAGTAVAFEVGSVVNVYQMGTATVTIAGGSGVTVRNDGDISDQYGEVSLRKRDTNEWVLVGQVS
jgi:hypothetical protein